MDDLIAAIGTIDLQSDTTIAEAETAYNSLSDKDKKSVDGRKQLEDARNSYDILKANVAHDAIQNIGWVYESSLTDIQYARKEYDSLTDHQKTLVDNYDDLVAAEEEYTRLKVEPVENLIQKINAYIIDTESISLPDGFSEAIDKAQDAFERLPEEYQDKVSNLDELKML